VCECNVYIYKNNNNITNFGRKNYNVDCPLPYRSLRFAAHANNNITPNAAEHDIVTYYFSSRSIIVHVLLYVVICKLMLKPRTHTHTHTHTLTHTHTRITPSRACHNIVLIGNNNIAVFRRLDGQMAS
jgi:hypothetical protein